MVSQCSGKPTKGHGLRQPEGRFAVPGSPSQIRVCHDRLAAEKPHRKRRRIVASRPHHLTEHGQLARVLTIRHPQAIRHGGKIELDGPDGEPVLVDSVSIADLPRLLRNGIAHFNVLPLDRDGRFAGIRTWNADDRGNIILVADLDFDAVRPLARKILKELADPSRDDLDLPNPEDPLEAISLVPPKAERVRKPPVLVDTVWNDLLSACGGDWNMALTEVNRTLRKRASDLRITS